MKQFTTILCLALCALASARPNYQYQAPVPPQQQFRPNVPQQQVRPVQQQTSVNSGIYSPVQSPPLPQFVAPVQQQQVQQQVQTGYVQQSGTIVQQQPAKVVVQQQVQPQQQQTFVTAPQVTQTVTTTEQHAASGQQYVQPQVQTQQVTYQQPQVQTQQQVSYQQPQVQTQQQVTYQQPQVQTYQQPQVQTQQVTYQQPQVQTQQVVTTQPQQQAQVVSRPQQTIITKDIFIHSAPEETEEVLLNQALDNNVPVRKNYRIVFIKAPTQNLKITSAALKQVQAANEEKTVIYVLSKKPDVQELQQQLSISAAEPKQHKPEVYFIKYKTTEEAQRAQQEIQAQYDALGGSTHVSDEGIAPVRQISDVNFVNNYGSQSGSTQYSGAQQHGGQVTQQVTQQVTSTQTQPLGHSQTFVQQNSGGSSVTVTGTGPSTKYLPAKALK